MRRRSAGIVVAVLLTAAVSAQERPAEPEDYRMEHYQAPVPATLKGARVLSTDEAKAIWSAGSAVFVDVLPHAPRPKNLPAGTVWRDAPRTDIPGSIWLPDTGYGALAGVTEDYLRQGLSHATGGDSKKQLVFYCREACWMSWNAAKRVLTYGYANVAWYPEGTDGWQRANLPLVEAHPEPKPGE